MQQFEQIVTGEIPDENADLGPEAQVGTKKAAKEIVAYLEGLGLKNVREERRLVRKTGPRPVKAVDMAGAPTASSGEAATVGGAAHRGRPTAGE